MRVTIPIVVSVLCAAVAGAQTPPTSQPAPTGAEAPATATSMPAPQPPPDPVVLTVNGDPIHAGSVRLAVQNVISQLRRQGQKPEQQQVMQAATQQVIDSTLLAQEARRRDVELDTSKVSQILEDMERRAGGRESLQGTLDRAGVSYGEFEGAVQESQLALNLVERDIRPTVTVSDEELQTFYKENPKQFERPEQIHARHILIKVPEDATPEQDAQAKQRAEAARQRAVSGEDFAALAKELSEDLSAEDGGDLGFFSKDQMVEPFASAAFALEPGDISPIVKTRFGYHVIKVEERRPAGTETLQEVMDPLRQALVNQKVGEEVGKLLQSLREKADIQQVTTPPESGEGSAPNAAAPTPSSGP